MKIALTGLPFSGKTTVFKALAAKDAQPKASASGKTQLNIAALKLQDERLEKLAQMLNSQKVTFAKIDLIDIALSGEAAAQGLDTVHIREFDALAIVIASFSSPEAIADLKKIEAEFMLADMQLIQNRIARVQKERKASPKKEEDPELTLLQLLLKTLEEERLIKELDLTPEQLKMLAGYQLLTLKPQVVVANISEEDIKAQGWKQLEKTAQDKGLQFFVLCAKLEAEIMELAEEERNAFMQEMGLMSLSSDRFRHLCLQELNKISFFTVVGKEARAWAITQGTTALGAAGSVHSDMERGFIRAEVINYRDFVECGSFAKAKEKGLLRLESKEYSIQDGDIINFKFSV